MTSLWDKQAPSRVVKTVSEPVKPAAALAAAPVKKAAKKKPAARKA